MKAIVIAVFDKAAGAFGAPQVVPAAGVAIRQFEDVVNGAESVYSKHPEHFELYQIAVYDDSNGAFDCTAPPFILANGASLKTQLPSGFPAPRAVSN